jgi:hypothetical protein
MALSAELRAAVTLTPSAVEFRYADPFEASPLDRGETLVTVAAVVAWAARTIETSR